MQRTLAGGDENQYEGANYTFSIGLYSKHVCKLIQWRGWREGYKGTTEPDSKGQARPNILLASDHIRMIRLHVSFKKIPWPWLPHAWRSESAGTNSVTGFIIKCQIIFFSCCNHYPMPWTKTFDCACMQCMTACVLLSKPRRCRWWEEIKIRTH